MSTQETATEVVQNTLERCMKSDMHGKSRLGEVRQRLLEAGFTHTDTLGLCRSLGFHTMGLHILSHTELGRQRRVS